MYKPLAIAMAVVSLQILFQLTLCTCVASLPKFIHVMAEITNTYHPEDSALDTYEWDSK